MILGLALSLLIAATVDPLPKELEYRLSLARAIPVPYSAAVIVALIPSAKLSAAQTTALAEEAYNLAGPDRAVAVKAWTLYRDHYDKKAGVPLGFPLRVRTVAVGCEANEVDDPKAYYRNALEAGAAEFTQALQNVRSAVEVGRAIEALTLTSPAEQARLLPLVLNKLAGAAGSDREFVQAIRFTRLHTSMLKLAETNGRQILSSYRTFLTTNWAATRCAGNRADEFRGIIDEFNKAVRQSGVGRLDYEASNVISVDTATKVPPAKSYPLGYKVVHAPIDETSVTGMLHEIEQFQPAEKPDELAVLLAKNAIYRRLSERLKDSIWQDRVVRDWVHFVAYSSLRTDDAPQWFACAKTFVDWAKDSSARQSELITAGDAGLSAYVRLVTLLPESEVTRVLP